MTSQSRQRYTFIVPAARVDDARAIAGDDSFRCALGPEGPPNVVITHYAAAFQPGEVSDEQRSLLAALPNCRSYALVTNPMTAILVHAGLAFVGAEVDIPPEE